jgi:hypothetical protein
VNCDSSTTRITGLAAVSTDGMRSRKIVGDTPIDLPHRFLFELWDRHPAERNFSDRCWFAGVPLTVEGFGGHVEVGVAVAVYADLADDFDIDTQCLLQPLTQPLLEILAIAQVHPGKFPQSSKQAAFRPPSQ